MCTSGGVGMYVFRMRCLTVDEQEKVGLTEHI